MFFFQAEDGIRDLVRSRGLGDVYKRQHPQRLAERAVILDVWIMLAGDKNDIHMAQRFQLAVSYTHLTLPTSDLV